MIRTVRVFFLFAFAASCGTAHGQLTFPDWWSNRTVSQNVYEGAPPEGPRLGNAYDGFIEGVVTLPFDGDWTVQFLMVTDEDFTGDEEYARFYVDGALIADLRNDAPGVEFEVEHEFSGGELRYRFDFHSPVGIHHRHIAVIQGTIRPSAWPWLDFDDVEVGTLLAGQFHCGGMLIELLGDGAPPGGYIDEIFQHLYRPAYGNAMRPWVIGMDPPLYDIQFSFGELVDYFFVAAVDADEPVTIRAYLGEELVASDSGGNGSNYQFSPLEVGDPGGDVQFDRVVIDLVNTGGGNEPGPEAYDLVLYHPVSGAELPRVGRHEIPLTSTDAGDVSAVLGGVEAQLAALNAGPIDAQGWEPLANRHVDFHVPEAFECDDPDIPDPLALPYVSADWFIEGADEVTYDNCSSAFYRFVFDLPPCFENASIYGAINCDDLGIVFLNGHRISAELLIEDVEDFDDGQTEDRVDDLGQPLLNWPTQDWFAACDSSYFVAGENELVIGIMGDASAFEPTGVEFIAQIHYDVFADLDESGAVDFGDLLAVLAAWGPCDDCEEDLDDSGAVDFGDLLLILAAWGPCS